ncbi:MAG: hypothetical protein KBF88_07450 [Polyangiaceae bacterium]|nr:hypothetical protein [Polyangiaceae bacterium]
MNLVPRSRVRRNGVVLTKETGGTYGLSSPDGLRAVIASTGEVQSVQWGKIRDPLERDKIRSFLTMAGAQLRGALVLHGSATALPEGGAVAFVGPSYSGKSTMGALFAKRPHYKFIADDLVLLERIKSGYQLSSTDRQPWVRPDVRALLGLSRGRTKKPMLVRNRVESASLLAVVSLRFDDRLRAPRVRKLSAIEGFQRVLSCKVKVSFDDRENWQSDVQSVAELVERVRIFECVRPKRTDVTEKTIELILASVSNR